MKTLRIYISGTVQGVMFRKYIEEQANKIGVRGFVRNMEDGKVEVVAEGVDERVLVMLEICKKGTQHATVRDVQFQEIKNQGFVGFKIFRI
jgi:acylphosphatase